MVQGSKKKSIIYKNEVLEPAKQGSIFGFLGGLGVGVLIFILGGFTQNREILLGAFSVGFLLAAVTGYTIQRTEADRYHKRINPAKPSYGGNSTLYLKSADKKEYKLHNNLIPKNGSEAYSKFYDWLTAIDSGMSDLNRKDAATYGVGQKLADSIIAAAQDANYAYKVNPEVKTSKVFPHDNFGEFIEQFPLPYSRD